MTEKKMYQVEVPQLEISYPKIPRPTVALYTAAVVLMAAATVSIVLAMIRSGPAYCYDCLSLIEEAPTTNHSTDEPRKNTVR